MLKVSQKLCGKRKVLRLPSAGLESVFSDFSVLPLSSPYRRETNFQHEGGSAPDLQAAWLCSHAPVLSKGSPGALQEGTSTLNTAACASELLGSSRVLRQQSVGFIR